MILAQTNGINREIIVDRPFADRIIFAYQEEDNETVMLQMCCPLLENLTIGAREI
jgi:hypothetical protein